MANGVTIANAMQRCAHNPPSFCKARRTIRHLALVAALLSSGFGCDSNDSNSVWSDGGVADGGRRWDSGNGNRIGDAPTASTGSVFVIVTDQLSRAVADASVRTEPASLTTVTDALGSVLLRSLTPGIYTIVATHPTLGVGRAPVVVSAGAVATTTIALAAGGIAPPPGIGAGAVDAGVPSQTGGISVNLAPASKDTNGVDLNWMATPDTTVSAFKIYRSDPSSSFQVINLISDKSINHYRDETVKLGVTYSYRVGAKTSDGLEVQSNVQTIASGVYVDVATQVTAMKVDPKRPYLYAIDTVNNSLLFVNTATNTVEKTIFIGSKPQDLDINVAGSELYVANFGASQIAVVNLETREQARALTVATKVGTWGGNPYRVACTAADTLVFTSQDQWQDLKLVSAQTGANFGAYGTLYSPQLVASPDGTHLYASGDGVVRYDVVGNQLVQADKSDYGELGSESLILTGDGKYLFSGPRKVLATNLKSVLGTLSEPALAANSDGSVVIGKTQIFDGTTFAIKSPLPLSTAILALSADDKTLYLYDTKTSRIYIYRLAK